MTNTGINWSDIAVESKSTINWADVASESHGGVNWEDLSVSSNSGINWAGINTLMSNMQSVFDRVGTPTDTGTTTLFGQLYNITQLINSLSSGGGSTAEILAAVQEIEAVLGTTTDTSAKPTVIGNIKSVEGLIGTPTSTTTSTLFGSPQRA